jgi:signal transduction histidine kinase
MPERKVDLLNSISYELYDHNDSLAQVYAAQALDEALKRGYLRGQKRAYTLMGIGRMSVSDYPDAFALFRKSLSLDAPESEDLNAQTYVMLANTHRDLSNFDSANINYTRAMELAVPLNDSNTVATILKNRGWMYVLLFQNVEAIDDLYEAQKWLGNQKDNYLRAEIWSNLGRAYANLLRYDRAKEYYANMWDLIKDGKDYFHLIKYHLDLADLAERLGNYSEALDEAFTAINYFKIYNYPPQQVEAYIAVAELYENLAQYELAGRYYFEALKIAENLQLKQRMGFCYAGLAWTFKELMNYDMALEYINKSQRIREEINDQHGISNSHNIRGLIFLLQKKYDLSLQELENSKLIREKIGHLEGIAACMFNISLVYEARGDYAKVTELQLQAIDIERKIGNKLSLGISLNSMASLYIQQNNLDKAETYAVEAREISRQTQSRLLLRNNYKVFADLNEARNNHKEALRNFRLYQQLSDSIYSITSRTKLAEMQAIYQLEQKEQEIKLLGREKQLQASELALQKSQLRQQRIVIGAGILAVLLTSVLAWNMYRSKKELQKANFAITEQHEEIQTQAEELTEANEALVKLNRELSEKQEEIQAQSEELIEANQTIGEINKGLEVAIDRRTRELKQAYKELDTFFYRSSHDFRRPLTTFLGLAEVAKITVKDPAALELFSKVKETAHNLDKMLVKLQSISDVGTQELNYKEVMVGEIFGSVCDHHREELTAGEFLITSDIVIKSPFISYPVLVKVIIENLIENSIQFPAPVQPKIHFKVSDYQDALTMEVTDNGHGIDPEYHSRIFDMYFRASHHSKGNGLGLYIVKKAVEKLNGTISFTSSVGEGTMFTVTLPRDTKINALA